METGPRSEGWPPVAHLEPIETLAETGVYVAPHGELGPKPGVPGGVRGGWNPPRRNAETRKPRRISPLDLEAADPFRGIVLEGRPVESHALELGVDLERARAGAGVQDRASVLRWLDDTVRTRPSKRHPEGRPRRPRVARCGSLWAARQGAKLGLAHKACRDRMCPRCMEKRQQGEARELRRWCDERWSKGASVLFATLTQVKLPLEHEAAKAAILRLLGTRREAMNTRGALGKGLRQFFRGGVWFVELVWSYRGRRNKDGSRVAYSGWHAHLHGLLELAPVPDGMVRAAGPERAALAWYQAAQAALRRAWLAVNPEASGAAQHSELADRGRAGQVCKYPLAPFEVASAERAREAAVALVGRRTHDAWGEWRGWKKRAQALLEQDRIDEGVPEPEPVVFGDCTLLGLLYREYLQGRVHFDTPDREDTTGIPASDVIAAIRADPRTLQARAEDQAANERGPP